MTARKLSLDTNPNPWKPPLTAEKLLEALKQGQYEKILAELTQMINQAIDAQVKYNNDILDLYLADFQFSTVLDQLADWGVTAGFSLSIRELLGELKGIGKVLSDQIQQMSNLLKEQQKLLDELRKAIARSDWKEANQLIADIGKVANKMEQLAETLKATVDRYLKVREQLIQAIYDKMKKQLLQLLLNMIPGKKGKGL